MEITMFLKMRETETAHCILKYTNYQNLSFLVILYMRVYCKKGQT
jgi:hypothetical protein